MNNHSQNSHSSHYSNKSQGIRNYSPRHPSRSPRNKNLHSNNYNDQGQRAEHTIPSILVNNKPYNYQSNQNYNEIIPQTSRIQSTTQNGSQNLPGVSQRYERGFINYDQQDREYHYENNFNRASTPNRVYNKNVHFQEWPHSRNNH